jgi:hypothetical protein
MGPAIVFVEKWDHNNRCVIEVNGVHVRVSHLHLPTRSKPYFGAFSLDSRRMLCPPAASFTALNRRLHKVLAAVAAEDKP